MRTHGAVVGRRFRSVTKLTTIVRIGRGYLWWRFLIAAAALKTPTRNGYNAQGVNLNFVVDKTSLYQLSSKRVEDNWHSGLLSFTPMAALRAGQQPDSVINNTMSRP